LKISLVEPNREQPRKEFQEEGLSELAASIRQYGILQPLVVQKRDDYYEIIAGERRWRAARLAGLKEVPVIIKDYSDQEIVEVSLIENIQREDLNPIEEALAYQRLLDEFSLRQEDIAKRVSKNRSTITNSLRLLKLDERVREMLAAGQITGGHARALLGLENKEQQFEAAKKIADENMSVREVEKLIRSIQKGAPAKKKEPKKDTALDLVCESMENDLKAALGTQVHVNRKNSKAGKIEIEYYSMEELERIYDLLRQTAG
jgi:ParB family chromosome partitioning protein